MRAKKQKIEAIEAKVTVKCVACNKEVLATKKFYRKDGWPFCSMSCAENFDTKKYVKEIFELG